MFQVGGTDRMRVQVDAAEVDDPDQLGTLVEHDLGRGST